MPRKRTDPDAPIAPQVSAVVTVATHDRIIELAAAEGVSRSAAARGLLELGLAALDEDAGEQQQ
jgi:hypothetical protein